MDLSLFQKPPGPRFALGLIIVGASYVLGWPAMTVVGILAVYWRMPKLGVVGVPLLYATSWVVFGVGILLAGKDTMVYAKALSLFALQKLVRRVVGA